MDITINDEKISVELGFGGYDLGGFAGLGGGLGGGGDEAVPYGGHGRRC